MNWDKFKVDKHGLFGAIFTFLSMTLLLILGACLTCLMIYGACQGSTLMILCCIMCLVAVSIAWLSYYVNE